MNEQRIPVSLVWQHPEMLKGLGTIALRTLKLSKPKKLISDWQQVPTISRIIPAPTDELVNHYVAWSGAPSSRYAHHVPPHMVSQWGLPVAIELLLLTKYQLASVINQGVSLKVYGDIPRHEELLVQANIHSIQESEGIARVAVKIITGTVVQPELVEVILHMAFLLPGFKKSKKTKSEDLLHWKTVGNWKASQHDGFKFALLTGDFNPIHWIALAGKLSAFQHKVLHGYGMLVRTYELLPMTINQLDVRFLKPVLLPSKDLSVQIAQSSDGSHQFRLLGTQDTIHLSGQYQ